MPPSRSSPSPAAQTPVLAPVPPRRLAGYALGALAAAAAAVLLGVLPAEFGVDPTGFGRLSGLDRLYAPPTPDEITLAAALAAPPEVATAPATPFRTDAVTIEVGGMQRNWGQIEYKLSLAEGDDLVYSWRASAPLHYEFHGHTEPDAAGEIQVMTYLQGTSETGQGRLTAPLDGIHGWFFRNDTFELVTVEFTFAGFYDLAPGILQVGRADPPQATEEDAEDAEAVLDGLGLGLGD